MAKKYYDIHTEAVGSIYDIRVVKTKGKDLLAFRAALLVGDGDSPDKRYVDVMVVGGQARSRIMRIQELIQSMDEPWVMAQFKFGDLRWETFTYRSGDKAGQTGISVKTRLLQLKNAWIDKELVVFGDEDSQSDSDHQQLDASSDDVPMIDASDDAPADTNVSSERPADLPDVVRLTKDDPNFQQRKADLKERGYRFNPGDQTWTRPAA